MERSEIYPFLGPILHFLSVKKALLEKNNGESERALYPGLHLAYHKKWVSEYLGKENNIRDEKWTRSIAVGSRGFVDRAKSILGALAIGRKSIEAGEAYELREPSIPYGSHFWAKKGDIRPKNTYPWDVSV